MLIIILLIITAAAIIYERSKRRRLVRELTEILSGQIDPTSEGEHSPVLRLALDLRKGCETREAKLREGYLRLSQLVSDIAHQTKTPLAALKLQLEGSSLTSDALEQSERLEFLIDALTTLSRCESGLISGNLKPRESSIPELLADSLSSVYPSAEAKSIRFEVDCKGSPTAIFDPRWTAEALFNLLDNAVKYAPSSSAVRLGVTELESFVRIDVTDEGDGLTEEELGYIWERFRRGRASEGSTGVGIGLYLTREIVQAEGGRVRAEVGTCGRFSVWLPR